MLGALAHVSALAHGLGRGDADPEAASAARGTGGHARQVSDDVAAPLAELALDVLSRDRPRRECLAADLRAAGEGDPRLAAGAALALLRALLRAAGGRSGPGPGPGPSRWGGSGSGPPAAPAVEATTSAVVGAALTFASDVPPGGGHASAAPEGGASSIPWDGLLPDSDFLEERAVTHVLAALLTPPTRRGAWAGLLRALCVPHPAREHLCAEVLATLAGGCARQGLPALAALPAKVTFRLLVLTLERLEEPLLGGDRAEAGDSATAATDFFRPRASAPPGALAEAARGLAVAEQLARVAGEALLAADDPAARPRPRPGCSARQGFLSARLAPLLGGGGGGRGRGGGGRAEKLAAALLLREHGPIGRPALQATQPWTEPLLCAARAGLAADAPGPLQLLQDLWMAEALARHASHLHPEHVQALARGAMGAAEKLGPASRRPPGARAALRAAAAAVVAAAGDTLARSEARRVLQAMAAWEPSGRELLAVAVAVGQVGSSDPEAARTLFRRLFRSRDCVVLGESFQALAKVIRKASGSRGQDFRAYVPREVFDPSELGSERQAQLHPFFLNLKVHLDGQAPPAPPGPAWPGLAGDLARLSALPGCPAAADRVDGALDDFVPRPALVGDPAGDPPPPAAAAPGGQGRKRGADENEPPSGSGQPPSKLQRGGAAAAQAERATLVLEELAAALGGLAPAERSRALARVEPWLRKILALAPPQPPELVQL